jgi:hypothetical protein
VEGRRRERLIEGGMPSAPPLPLLNGSTASLGLMRGRDRYKSTRELNIEDEGAQAHGSQKISLVFYKLILDKERNCT